MEKTSSCRADIDGGWAWLVMFAVYASIVCVTMATYGSGIIYVALLEYYGESESKTSIIGALNTGLMCVLGPVASLLINLTSCRVSMVLGGVFMSLGFFCSAFVNSIDGLILTYGLIGGIGNGLASASFVIALGFYFEERRNIVIAMSVGVIGLGFLISSPFLLYLLDYYGLHSCFLILSGLTAQICVAGVICRPSTIERRLHVQRQKHQLARTVTEVHSIGKQGQRRFRHIVKSFTHLLQLPLVLFLLSTFSWNLTLSVCIMHLPNYIAIKSVGKDEIKKVMTIFSASNMAGRFIGASTVGKGGLDSLMLHVGSLGVAGIATVTFPWYSNLSGADYVFAALIGLYTGAPNSLMTPVTLKIVGVSDLSMAVGFEYFFCGVGVLIGPPIAGYLYGLSGSYVSSFIFSGLINVLGSVLAMASAITVKKDEHPEQTTSEIQIFSSSPAENREIQTSEHVAKSAIVCETDQMLPDDMIDTIQETDQMLPDDMIDTIQETDQMLPDDIIYTIQDTEHDKMIVKT